MKNMERKAGILMHITSLPGKYDIGDLGPEAYKFADFLKRCNQHYWQILPLNQVENGSAYSPYSAISAFSGNTLLISPERLVEQKLIDRSFLNSELQNVDKVNFEAAEKFKNKIIHTAYKNLKNGDFISLEKEFKLFCKNEKYWLHDYALFAVLRQKFQLSVWNEWPDKFRDRDKKALNEFEKNNSDNIEREKFAQFLFSRQWNELKDYCNSQDIKIFGDMPIYVGYNSSDVWSHPELFNLKKNSKLMKTVAGVPPDRFSNDGQLWGLPIFRWDEMKKEGFAWWKERVKKNLELYDLLRLDHFRGFSAYWEVPFGETTARNGKWKKGPAFSLFDELKKEFPSMPFVAEDLGQIDQPVYDLRDKYNMPGMMVLHFAFGGDLGTSTHINHNHPYNSIVYTGTHDNNSSRGWFKHDAGKKARYNIKRYLNKNVFSWNSHTELLRLAYSSVAKLAIIPIQDILGLNSSSRMNIPATATGNWQWRLKQSYLKPKVEKQLNELVNLYGRK